MKIGTLDILVFISYLIGLILLSFFVSREKDGKEKNAEDYFLAGKSLPWWAIGSSLIAANISAEQIIGMSGSGYAIGMAMTKIRAIKTRRFMGQRYRINEELASKVVIFFHPSARWFLNDLSPTHL